MPQLGMTLTNAVVSPRIPGGLADGKRKLKVGFHELAIPVKPNFKRYGDPIVIDRKFEKLVFAAANKAPLTVSTARKKAPPADAEKRIARARKRGRFPMLFSGLYDREAASLVAHVGRKPAWRWLEPHPKFHCLQYLFKSEEEAKRINESWYQREVLWEKELEDCLAAPLGQVQ